MVMKKNLLFVLLISIIFIGWCDILCEKTEEKITETLWGRTCVWKWVYKIEWYANCKTTDWWSYAWDIRWHKFNWKWKLTTPDWEIQDGYFYNWDFVAGKVSFSNGNASKWLRIPNDKWGSTLESWKTFTKNNWQILIWDFDENWYLKYWMNSLNWSIVVGEFKNGWIYNWYLAFSNGCHLVSKWNIREITRTITNTVYRNNWIQLSNPLWDLYALWGKYNPYTVQLELK